MTSITIFNEKIKDSITMSNTLDNIEAIILKYECTFKILLRKRSWLLRLSRKLCPTSKILFLKEDLYLYLLRNNLYIKNTSIRKLIKLEILKAPEFRVYCLYLNHIIQLVISIMKIQILSKSIGLEHPSVKRVIEIAEDIMSKNKILNVETLYNVAKKRLKLPRNGLLFIIQFLINKKILIEGSKFSKETVLLNSIRKSIYNYIRLNPGVHFSILRRKALSDESGSSGQLVWHLEMLLKFNYISKIKVGNYTVFLPFDMSEDIGKLIFLLRDRITNKIVHLLIGKETLVKSEIYKQLEEKRENVYYRINNLQDHDVIAISESSDKEVCLNSNKKEFIIDILKSLKLNTENKQQ